MPSLPPPFRVPFRALAVVALTAGALLFSAARADAGTYRAVQCHEGLGAGHADAVFRATGERYRSRADCAGAGLEVSHGAGTAATRGGRYGEWSLAAPAGARIVRAALRVAAEGDDWHSPQVAVTLAGGARQAVAGVRGSLHPVEWAGAAGRVLAARLVCTHAERCGAGERAFVRVRRIALVLEDVLAPQLAVGGSLLEAGSRRGTQALEARTADAGGGVRSVSVELNGSPLASRAFECRLSQGVALRLRPCPGAAAPRFELATGAPGWRQGPNEVRVCAGDHATAGGANRECETRTVRVDNRCPVSAVHGAELAARFAGGGSRARVASDERARVVGRLTRDGRPVAGARVCVATRLARPGSQERFLEVRRTAADGSFAVTLPRGPNREVRVAHWPGSERALERYLRLDARAVPRLRLLPRRTLRNGERLRFRVGLPGPAAGRRRVEVQARAGGRWLRVAGGRTDRRGAWRGSYRFRSTTGERTYAFRAVVGREPGYPYGAGRSAVRRATVIGG